jgi:hypothetical protein
LKDPETRKEVINLLAKRFISFQSSFFTVGWGNDERSFISGWNEEIYI